MLELDHLAVSATTLDGGVAAIEALLGVPLAAGGEHPAMGTHNRLLGLGPELYLEVIAIDPAAPAPDRPRWFDLDNFTGPPRLTNWIVRAGDMAAGLTAMPDGSGVPMALSRGDLRWQMAVPEDGKLPFDGVSPALIAWQGAAHPAAMLPDVGCRLLRLELFHPQAADLQAVLSPVFSDPKVSFHTAPDIALRALIDTPGGRVTLS